MDGEVQAGQQIAGRYRLVRQIASGGMGHVWEARDERLGRDVAVKQMAMPLTTSAVHAERVARAKREAGNAASLEHPNIVMVYDVVVEAGIPWIIMQLVRGRSLREVLDDAGPLDVEAAANVAAAVLAALHAAHTNPRRIIHRDVKPANILVSDEGRILLADFGIAKGSDDTRVTESGSVLGSLAYIAPERAEGHEGGPPCDLFSLGVTLFETVEGYSPFERDNKTGTLTAILVKPLPPMTRAGRLAQLIAALTAKDPGRRPTVAQALEMLHGRPSSYTPPAEVVTGQGTSQKSNSNTRQSLVFARRPWQTVDASATTGGPKPAVITAGKSSPPPQRVTDKQITLGLAAVLAVALLAGAALALNQHWFSSSSNVGSGGTSVTRSGSAPPVASSGTSSSAPESSQGTSSDAPTDTGSASSSIGAAGSGTASSTGVPDSSSTAGNCQLSLSLTTRAPAYASGDDPEFTVALSNEGTSICDIDVSPKSLVLNVYSGQERVWSTADCATGSKDVRAIAPSVVQTVTYTWNRTGSTAGCPADSQAAMPGIYFSVVSLVAGSGPAGPQVQSQPKTFELKSGI